MTLNNFEYDILTEDDIKTIDSWVEEYIAKKKKRSLSKIYKTDTNVPHQPLKKRQKLNSATNKEKKTQKLNSPKPSRKQILNLPVL